ncbi:hypothetical protein EMEDMD4_530205 [Sinorhizobium medicae]|uniref:Uncharacterized protein n=1 Tax=Sinorhizobium medicae TaxID=110321 RepID=A0A508X2E2_9HYPH|nr:hypothetical protein EMEDMD4_530205 [Sinorhizobium medicae]
MCKSIVVYIYGGGTIFITRTPSHDLSRRGSLSDLIFDRCFIDDGKYIGNLAVCHFIKHVFCEGDAPTIDCQSKETAFRRAVELQSCSDEGRFAGQTIDLEKQVGNILEILYEHRPIARQSQETAIVSDIAGNIPSKLIPVLSIQAINVVTIKRVQHYIPSFAGGGAEAWEFRHLTTGGPVIAAGLVSEVDYADWPSRLRPTGRGNSAVERGAARPNSRSLQSTRRPTARCFLAIGEAPHRGCRFDRCRRHSGVREHMRWLLPLSLRVPARGTGAGTANRLGDLNAELFGSTLILKACLCSRTRRSVTH